MCAVCLQGVCRVPNEEGIRDEEGILAPCLCLPPGARSGCVSAAGAAEGAAGQGMARRCSRRGSSRSLPAPAAFNSIQPLLSLSHNRCLMIITCYCIVSHISFLSAASYSGSLNYVNSLLEICDSVHMLMLVRFQFSVRLLKIICNYSLKYSNALFTVQVYSSRQKIIILRSLKKSRTGRRRQTGQLGMVPYKKP